MRRRVHSPAADPRQAPLPIERVSAGDAAACDAGIISAALVLGRLHAGLDAALAVAVACCGSISAALVERATAAFLAEGLAVDRETQTISTWIPALPRAGVVRGRVEWASAMLAAETHEPSPSDEPRAPAIMRDANGEAVYLYRDPPPVIIVADRPMLGEPEHARAREHLVYAIERGLITRAQPHRT